MAATPQHCRGSRSGAGEFSARRSWCDGRRDLLETTRDDLSGYADARPVRVGNSAFRHRQNDVFGAVLELDSFAHPAPATSRHRARPSQRAVLSRLNVVSAFAIIGEPQRTRDLRERLLRIASPLGLYAEEFDSETGKHLGNFPQASSHLALIEAAARMIVPELAHF